MLNNALKIIQKPIKRINKTYVRQRRFWPWQVGNHDGARGKEDGSGTPNMTFCLGNHDRYLLVLLDATTLLLSSLWTFERIKSLSHFDKNLPLHIELTTLMVGEMQRKTHKFYAMAVWKTMGTFGKWLRCKDSVNKVSGLTEGISCLGWCWEIFILRTDVHLVQIGRLWHTCIIIM